MLCMDSRENLNVTHGLKSKLRLVNWEPFSDLDNNRRINNTDFMISCVLTLIVY